MKVLPRIESSHLPVTLDIFISSGDRSNSRSMVQKVEKIVWNKDKEILFVNELNSAEMQNTLEQALHEISNNVNNALDLFVDCVTSASHCMKKQQQKNRSLLGVPRIKCKTDLIKNVSTRDVRQGQS